MATTPDLQEPQIAAARASAWHQTGEPLLTLEAARTWLNEFGLVLFAPRANGFGSPAPSLVEATLGEGKQSVAPAEAGLARNLAARLVGEGSALPLNLLGGPGDLPDFLVSTQAFPFLFTLRGDKGWKRPPETTGAVKVTPLSLHVYNLLAEKGALTITEIVPEIGREVNEAGTARALSELWGMLRVIPVLQQGEGETRWELTTNRFLKAIKAGANAGQPTALSALVSLYLAQALVATEEEIAAFLSPLTARSRVRDVLHGLSAGRQLLEGVVNGKTVLYVPDALPDFTAFAKPEMEANGTEEDSSAPADRIDGAGSGHEPKERIRRFVGGDGKSPDRNLRGKPVRRDTARPPRREGARPPREGFRPRAGETHGRSEGGTPDRRSFVPRAGRVAGGGERATDRFGSRRPAGDSSGFARPDSARPGSMRPASTRPGFARPWDDERKSRPPRRPGAGPPSADEPTGPSRPRREAGDVRPGRPFRDASTARPSRGDNERPFRPRREGGEERPARSFRDTSTPRPPRRTDSPSPFPRRDTAGGGDGARRSGPPNDRPKRPFTARTEGQGRPFRPRPEGEGPPFRPRAKGEERPFRPAGGGGKFGEKRGPGGPPKARFGGDRADRAPRSENRNSGGATDRPTGRGRPSFGTRPPGEGRPSPGGRPNRLGNRPGFGGSTPRGPKKPSAKSPGRPERPTRPPRPARPEDEA